MSIRYLFFIMLIAALASSCTKDEDIKAVAQKTDSVNSVNLASAHPNMLAVSGSLKITVQDSTYIFDAKTDSIAVVNIYLDNQKYFGITAINKAHTMSFGISSPGYAAANTTKTVAGGQFLFNPADKHNVEYSLTQNVNIPEPGRLVLTQYSRDSVLAKGTFTTYLSRDVKATSPFYKVEGSFELRVK